MSETAVMASTVTGTLRLTSAGARVIFAIFFGVHVFIAVASLDIVKVAAVSIVALAVLAVGTLVLALPAAEPYPLARTVLVLGVVVVTSVLVDWNLPDSGFTGYASWPFGANTLLLVVVALRGRSTLAWVGWVLMLGIAIAWGLSVGRPIADPLAALSTHAGTLLVGSLFALGLRRTIRRTTQLHTEQAALVAQDAAARARLLEQAAQSVFLETVARPALERIAADVPYDDGDRRRWVDLESSIRDSLRAPGLMVPALVTAAARARDRGVAVTILDDSEAAPLDSAELERVIVTIVAELDSARSGEFTARLLPAGRPVLATIVLEGAQLARVVDVPA